MVDFKLQFGSKTIQNRIVFQPMEGCDCNLDGSPSELTIEKYYNNAKSGAGIIWFEANAVCPEGRTNPRQMKLSSENKDVFKKLVEDIKTISLKENGFEPLLYLQLTHSGRQSIVPMIAYRNDMYEQKRPMTDDNIVSDEYLDGLPEKYVNSAILAKEVGFDGVDVKSCHGYLMQEMLSAFNRSGKYGGSLENRSRLYLTCVKSVKEVVPSDFDVVSRFGITDVVPKPFGFGTDENNNVDLTEPKIIIQKLIDNGVKMLNVTLGNPYFNPHVNRPYRVGGYVAPESAETGLQRFETVEKEIKKTFPDLLFVGSGLSYYRGDVMKKAEEQINNKICDLVGFGRLSLAYPQFYKDYLENKFEAKKTCVTCSRCTTLMRNHCVSGCAVFNEYYKNLYKEKIDNK